ncbi:MAG: hypothetical protein ISR54_08285 [Chlorobium phaeobacteroides]|nr:hypothetical protein [Chlorobium phaeobacteroides]
MEQLLLSMTMRMVQEEGTVLAGSLQAASWDENVKLKNRKGLGDARIKHYLSFIYLLTHE